MRARVALPAALLATLLALPPGTATAHDTKVFQACAAFTSAARYCLETIRIVRGDTVWLRAKVKPEHAGREVEAQIQNPGRTNWNTLEPTLTLSDGGRVKTSWEAGPGSVDENDPYRFRFKIKDPEDGPPHEGQAVSNSVAVWVFRP
jgi:hypothetical protein